MTDDETIDEIYQMTKDILFAFVMENPEYLTDSCYRKFGYAIRQRYKKFQRNI